MECLELEPRAAGWKAHTNPPSIGSIPGTKWFFRLFNTVDSKIVININFADDWIRTPDLWYRKQPLYQLNHNHWARDKVYMSRKWADYNRAKDRGSEKSKIRRRRIKQVLSWGWKKRIHDGGLLRSRDFLSNDILSKNGRCGHKFESATNLVKNQAKWLPYSPCHRKVTGLNPVPAIRGNFKVPLNFGSKLSPGFEEQIRILNQRKFAPRLGPVIVFKSKHSQLK